MKNNISFSSSLLSLQFFYISAIFSYLSHLILKATSTIKGFVVYIKENYI